MVSCNLHVCDATVEGLANTVVLGAPAKRIRSFLLAAPLMFWKKKRQKDCPPEDSFYCVSVDSEIVDQGETTESRSCQMLGVQHESLGIWIFRLWVFLAGGCSAGDSSKSGDASIMHSSKPKSNCSLDCSI